MILAIDLPASEAVLLGGAFLLFLLLDLAVTSWLVSMGWTGRGTGVSSGDRSLVDPDEERVRCPECGATNDLGYRLCRQCVGELPGRVGAGRDDRSPSPA